MYGFGGPGQVEVGEWRRRAKWLEEKKKEKEEEKEEEKEKTRCRSVPDGSDNKSPGLWLSRPYGVVLQ